MWAYLQSADNFMKDDYINPTGKFELNQDKLLELLNLLHGIAYIRDYWGGSKQVPKSIQHSLRKQKRN